MGLSDSLPGRPAVMYSHGALVASASARQGLPGSSADLSTRAVPNHPGRSDGCIRLLLRHRSCLASSKSGGLATFVFLSRPNRVHLRYGSRVRLASPPAPLLELAPARLRVEQAIYTMNSFQFIRSTRLLLAYPTSGRRTVRFLQQLPSPTRLLPSALFCGVLTPVPAGCSQFGTGAAVSEPNWISLFPTTSSLARVAVTRTRRLGQTLSGSYLLSLLP